MKTIKILQLIMLLFSSTFLITSCSSDSDRLPNVGLVVAFENPSENFSSPDKAELEIKLVFSEAADENGSIEIVPTLEGLTYGENEDFISEPAVVDGVLVLPIEKGDQEAGFKLKKKNNRPSENKQFVKFDITSLEPSNWITQGNTSLEVTFSDEASLGGSIKPEVGGPNQPNQVYVTLRTGESKVIRRDAWDLGFYAGADFRVKLNSSLKMFAGSTGIFDIDAVTADDVEEIKKSMVVMAEGSADLVDDPSGNIRKTAIQEIEVKDEDNPVYLVHLGNKIGTQTPEVGSVAVDEVDSRDGEGGLRGFKKVRILRSENGYLLQYADLDDSSHKEVEIPKSAAGNFNFYSLLEDAEVEVEPEQWDLNFTTHTAILSFGGGEIAYGFSDYVFTNVVGGVETALLSTEDFKYQDFTFGDLSSVEWVKDDQVISDQWRDVFNHTAADDVFFVLRDQGNNYYKIRFTAMVNENGERGHPAFEYQLLL